MSESDQNRDAGRENRRDGGDRPLSWPEQFARAAAGITSVSAERRERVLGEIYEGSQPTAIYYVLLGLSELIAGFALIVDSDATLIGANVVAPLMTPIFGVSLGLMRGDLRLLRRALLAEFGGAAFGVLLCWGLGLLPILGDPSPALLAQTRPTLIDLFVAALAGFAGVLAILDERISPALPGVAIATALNPPIAAVGLCLASGAYAGAWGAFLLFFANFLAILAVAAILFLLAGFVTRAEIGSLGSLARRFAAAGLGLVLVTALLSSALMNMVQRLRTERTIRTVLDHSLAHEPNTALVGIEFNQTRDGVDVLSTVRTPRVLSPANVKSIQDELTSRLGSPVRLFMRCSVTRDVSATGSTNLRPYLSLDGRVATAPMSPEMEVLLQTEQVAREVVSNQPGMTLDDLELVELPAGPVVIITIEGSRTPKPDDVARFRDGLRKRLARPDLDVVVRRRMSTDVTAKGRILLGEAHFSAATPAERERQIRVEESLRTAIEKIPDAFVVAVDTVLREGTWVARAEVLGPRVLTPGEVAAVEARTRDAIGENVALSAWTRAEVQVDAHGYHPLGERPD